MKDNKPLLFINSAQSSDVVDHSQYVYDSRFDKFEKKAPIHKEVDKKVIETEKDVTSNEIRDEVKETKEEKIEENAQKNEKLLNKLELLNKRAKLGRYVFVAIQIKDNNIEGYFKGLLDKQIILSVLDKDEIILIRDIDEIIILRV